jgi:hypothetical protein
VDRAAELIIEEMTKQWYASVDKAFNKVCPLKKIKVKEEADWWDEDCEVARQRYRSKYKRAHRQGCPSPADLKDLSILNRTLKNCIKHAKKTRFQEYVREVETLTAMAKLSKILRAKPSSVGITLRPLSFCTRSFHPCHFVPSYILSPVISSPVISSPGHFLPWSFRPLELNLQKFIPRERDLFKM